MSTPRPPLSTTTSLWPAAIVLITGIVMLASFTLINLIGNQGVGKNVTTTTILVVGGLNRDVANIQGSRCVREQNPPANIASALMLPLDTRLVAGPRFANQGAGDFDCSLKFSSTHGASALLAFFKNNLKPLGWNLFSQGASNGNPQSLFQRAGSDGFYWILGITINTFDSGSCTWTLRVYQNSGQI